MKINIFLSFLLLCSGQAFATPHIINENDSNKDCHNYPMRVAITWLHNNQNLDSSHINQTLGERISSDKIGKGMRNNVFYFVFKYNEEKTYEVITRNIAGKEECSISGADVYLISKSSEDKIDDPKSYLRYAE